MIRYTDDDCYVPAAAAAVSAEPFSRPDHKAKKTGKPGRKRRYPRRPRDGETIGGGHFVFRRGDSTGRIRPCEWPFEHSSAQAAETEALRLANEYGGTFDVYSRGMSVTALVDGGAE